MMKKEMMGKNIERSRAVPHNWEKEWKEECDI